MWSETIFSKSFFFICKVQGQKHLWQKLMGAYLQNAYVCVRSMLWGMSLLNNICWGAQVCFAVSLCSDGNSLVIAMTTKTSRQPSNISDDRRCVGEYQPLPACQFIIPLHFPPKQSSLHIKVARDIKCGRLISAAQACGAGKPLMFLGVWFAVRLTKPVQGDVYRVRGLCGGKWSTCSCFLYLNEKAEVWKAVVSQTQICSMLVQQRWPSCPRGAYWKRKMFIDTIYLASLIRLTVFS